MDSPRPSQHTLHDFLQWREAGTLSLSPKFQRRAVWTPTQRSYFIDTVLQDMPSPQIYLRNIYNIEDNKVVHEVVDGQQRLNAVLDFYDGKFAISPNLEAPYSGKRYSTLTKAEKLAFNKYRFNCESFEAITDREVHEVFRRMNTYSSPLTKQELRHGRFFGLFRRTCETLSGDYLEFWRSNRIVSETGVARMAEVQLTSSLLISQMAGMQDKSNTIDDFYLEYDSKFTERGRHAKRFRETIDQISDTFGEDTLRGSQFRRQPLFYSLFSVVYHYTFGMPKQRLATPKRKMRDSNRSALLEATEHLSSVITFAREQQKMTQRARQQVKPVPSQYQDFVVACLSQTDNINPRQTRFDTLYREAFR